MNMSQIGMKLDRRGSMTQLPWYIFDSCPREKVLSRRTGDIGRRLCERELMEPCQAVCLACTRMLCRLIESSSTPSTTNSSPVLHRVAIRRSAAVQDFVAPEQLPLAPPREPRLDTEGPGLNASSSASTPSLLPRFLRTMLQQGIWPEGPTQRPMR